MNRKIKYSVSGIINAPRQIVWTVILSPALYKEVWQAKFSGDWKKNHKISFSGTWEGTSYKDKGTVLDIQDEKSLEYLYWSSFWNAPDIEEEYALIRYELQSLDTFSCELVITQTGFRDDIHYQETVNLWNDTIRKIKEIAEKEDLQNRVKFTLDNLTATMAKLTPLEYNREREKKWTIGQLVEHIRLGNSDFKRFLTEGAAPITREYDVHIPQIRNMMNDQSHRMEAPEFLIPPVIVYDVKEHLSALLTIKDELLVCTELDLTQICTSLDIPPFGSLSFFEWLNFSIFHIERHRQQIFLRVQDEHAGN
ncbi:MAG TPA: SRPBCC domain-containing protein [Niabella sp.]|nr:SRPBCC domain-containing protein [Niabella sp.]